MTVRPFLCLPILFALAGCGPRYKLLPSSGPREPVSVDTVIIYQDHPSKYELLGTLEVPMTREFALDSRGRGDAMFVELKAQAAKLGANGVLLTIDNEKRFSYHALAGYYSRFYYVPMRDKPPTAIAEAIYVVEQ